MTTSLAADAFCRAVRDGNDLMVRRMMGRADFPRIAVEVARRVPERRRTRAGTGRNWPDEIVRPHGSHAAYNRHKRRGETPCPPCVVGEKAYQAVLYRRRRCASSSPARRGGTPVDLTNDFINPTIDWVRIHRFLNGDTTIRLTKPEKHDAYRQLRNGGVCHSQAAERLKLSGSTATIYRQAYEQIGATA